VLRQLAISCLAAVLALPSAARTRPHYGGTLRVEVQGDGFQSSDGLIWRLLMDGLTQVGADGTPQPALAVRWASENNDHRWQFWLRPGVQFANGWPLTPALVISSLEGPCRADCPWTAVHAVGTSILFTSDSPMPNLPSLLAGSQFLIHLTDAGEGKEPGCCIGTGPFQFTDPAVPKTLAANQNYWGGRPFVDKVEILTNKSIRDQWLDLSVGHADLVEVPAEQLRQAQQQHLTVIISPPVTLLALAVSDSGVLSNPNLRASIALAVDRSALSNVIFQKQGDVTASLLPAALTGYSFLFPTDRDLNKAHELRGGLTSPSLTLAADNTPAMQLSAQRLALNLHEAGFNVQVANSSTAQHKDLALLQLTLASSQPQPALESMLRSVGVATPVLENTPAGLYKVEREFLETHTLIPLLYLPRAYAISGRVRDLRLSADGSPLLADVSLQDAQ
jgi:peptide/nickel transport system substrate-binding protein